MSDECLTQDPLGGHLVLSAQPAHPECSSRGVEGSSRPRSSASRTERTHPHRVGQRGPKDGFKKTFPHGPKGVDTTHGSW